MRQGFYAGVNRTRPRSNKQIIADIKKAMESEPVGSPTRQQYERALDYWQHHSDCEPHQRSVEEVRL